MIYRAFPLFGSGNFIGQAFVEAPPEPLYQVERFTDYAAYKSAQPGLFFLIYTQ